MNKSRVVLLLTAVILSVMLGSVMSEAREDRILVETVAAQQENVYNSVTVSGQIESTTEEKIALSRFATVDEVYVGPGDVVVKGDALFKVSYGQGALSQKDVISALYDLTAADAIDTYISGEEEVICAGMDGVVMDVAQLGQQILPGICCTRIADPNRLQLRVSVPELYISQLQVGQAANFTITADSEHTFSATLLSIAPYAARTMSVLGSDSSPTIEAILRINSSSSLLHPGYSASIKIFTDRHEDAVTVPYEAVMQDGEEEYVYRVIDNVLVYTPVETGYALSRGIEVVSGLNAGERVAIAGEELLKDGMKVQTGDAA